MRTVARQDEMLFDKFQQVTEHLVFERTTQ